MASWAMCTKNTAVSRSVQGHNYDDLLSIYKKVEEIIKEENQEQSSFLRNIPQINSFLSVSE